MLEIILLSIAILGTAAAGYIDLKTTEVPDEIPFFMIGSALVLKLGHALTYGTWDALLSSIVVGIEFLIFGYILYYTGQWGEADVLVLAAVGFLIPGGVLFGAAVSIFPLTFIINSFIVGGIYSIAYAFVLALMQKNIFSSFYQDVKGSMNFFGVILGVYMAVSFVAIGVLKNYYGLSGGFLSLYKQTLYFIPSLIALLLLYRFAKVLDEKAFRKKIKTSELREGDVLAEDLPKLNISGKLFKGLEIDEIEKIKSLRKLVWIKEGIRYVPVFFFTILATWKFGNLFVLILALF